MAGGRWYFTKEQLENTPSRKCGIDSDKELSYRQQAANFIQDMGQRLQVSQLCINTAIVYMHRFYLFHSFTKFHRNAISTCSLFLAAKVEEQPRKLEHVIKVAHLCLHRENTPFDVKSDAYMEQSHELIANENIMLQTLGFDIGIDHPHTYVVKCCQLVRASKDLAQTSYIMATNSLHLTTMSLQYPPTVVACVCIHLACKWSDWELPASNEGKEWYWYVDQTVTKPLLEELTTEFLVILEKAPSRLKRKLSGGGKESEMREKRKLEVSLASPSSGIRSHEKESQPCEKRIRTEPGVTSSASVGPSNEKAHIHQEDKRITTPCSKGGPFPVATSKEIQPHRSKSSAVHNIPLPSLAKLPVSTSEDPSPSKRIKEGSHSITIADYKEMKEKQEQKAKGQNKVSNYNPQSHLAPSASKKPIKEERKPDFHQNTNERSRSKHHKTTHPKHTEDNLVTNEQQPAELTNTTEENLQQKTADDTRHTSSSRAMNSNRADIALSSTWYDKGKSESYLLKQKELPADMPVHSHSHQGKTSARPLVQETLVSQHTEQDTRPRHVSELPLDHAQTTTGNGENISQTKASKTKHQKHKVVPPVVPASLPQDDLPGHDRNAKKAAEGEIISNSKSADIAAIAHKSESEHSKRIDSSIEKISDFTPSRQDRREKHKHKHSSHSSEREKTSSNAEHSSSSSISGGLKITIPKEKIVSSTQRTNSSNSPRETLKIKINKGKIATNETSKSSSSANRNLKLVIAKDKKQRNSYSCTSYAYSPQKSDCDGQKREKSPTSTSASTSSEQLNVNRSPKVKYEHTASGRRSTAIHLSNDEIQIPLPPETNPLQHTNIISHNQQIMPGSIPLSSYHQPKPPHQAYVAYNQPQYFHQYFPCPPVHLNANTARLPQMFSNPRIPPPFLSDEPPLPKEPPPLPPPLPPE